MSESHSSNPRTQYAGESSPEDQRSARETGIIVLALSVLAFPVAAIFFGLQVFLFSIVRVSHKVLLSIALIYTVFLSVTGLIASAGMSYLTSFGEAFTKIGEDGFSASIVFQFFLDQFFISVLIGGLAGAAYCWWRYIRRPIWERVEFRRTPPEFYRRHKTIKNIKSDDNTPKNGMTLGVDDRTGKRIVQTFEEASAHTFVAGGSGSGKTVTMLTRARDVIKNGRSYVMLDLKGSRPLVDDLYELAQRYDRPFYHFSIAPPSDTSASPDPRGLAFYQPIYRGDASRRKDLILSLRSVWSEEHYEILAAEYLQTAMNVAIANPPDNASDALLDIIKLLDPQVLSIRAQGIPMDYPDAPRIKEAAQQLAGASKRDTAASITGIRGITSGLRDSTAGHWLRSAAAEGEREIDLYKAAEEGAVVVFTIDTSTYEKVGKQIANLIIQDMKTVSAELRIKPAAHPLHFDIDEFSALDGAHVLNLINKCRDANIPVTLATQALGDLAKISPIFKDQLLGIIANFIIHRANTKDDAMIYAGLTGQGKKWDVSYAVEQTSGSRFGGVGKGAATGDGRVSAVDDTKVPFNDITELKTGEMVYVGKSPIRLERVRVIREEGISLPSQLGATPAKRHTPEITAAPASQIERRDTPEIAPVQQSQIEASSEDFALEPRLAAPVKRSTGFIGGTDLNAALYGTKTPQPNTPVQKSTPTQEDSVPVESIQPPTQRSEPRKAPTAVSAPVPAQPHPQTPSTRLQRPMRPGGKLPLARPNSSNESNPPPAALPTGENKSTPPSSKNLVRKPASAKKQDNTERKFSEEW